ncbi:MAG: DUF1122 family protein [Candidatus Methylarchaceae archaeon HK02M1]|nr:DUF1122 family protein [Candidatus Methylarchaceae archaeon HK01M]MCP8312014.1 DUF1122 family protein [Candidatus Methylarchaceae archaeon HK02M1]
MQRSLYELHGHRLDKNYKLQIDIKQRHYFEQKYFELFILDEDGCKFHPHVFTGIYSAGRKSSGIKGWIDGDYYEKVSSDKVTLNLQDLGVDLKLFKKIGGLIQNGGSLMISYTMFWGESEVHKNTSRALDLGVPHIATPIGYLIFHAGCWAGFKDWYFPEGGNEGPKKLQGFKPLNREDALRRAGETIKLLKDFIERKGDLSDLELTANERSKEIIDALATRFYY